MDVVRHLGQGDVVGEVAIFTGEPRNATVRAIRDSDLIRLSKAQLHRLLERHPRGAIEMVRILAGRVQPVAPTRRDAPVSTIAAAEILADDRQPRDPAPPRDAARASAVFFD